MVSHRWGIIAGRQQLEKRVKDIAGDVHGSILQRISSRLESKETKTYCRSSKREGLGDWKRDRG